MGTVGCLAGGPAEVSGNAVSEWGFWTGGFAVWYSNRNWPGHGGGAEFSSFEWASFFRGQSPQLLSGGCKFQELRGEANGASQHSAHRLSLSCFQYGALPLPSRGPVSPSPQSWDQPIQKATFCLSSAKVEEGPLPGSLGWGKGTWGLRGSSGSLLIASVF